MGAQSRCDHRNKDERKPQGPNGMRGETQCRSNQQEVNKKAETRELTGKMGHSVPSDCAFTGP